MSFVTDKLSNFVQTKSGIELDDKLKTYFTSILESLILNSFQNVTTPSIQKSHNSKKKK